MVDQNATVTWTQILLGLGPSVLSVTLGGYVASKLVPVWQRSAALSKKRSERKVEISENVVRAFQHYITAWERLGTIARLERSRPNGLTAEEASRKEQFINERNSSRLLLLENLALIQLYFPVFCARAANDFCAWDEKLGTRAVNALPSLEEWRLWEERVVSRLREELDV